MFGDCEHLSPFQLKPGHVSIHGIVGRQLFLFEAALQIVELAKQEKQTDTVNICGMNEYTNTRHLCIHIFLFLHIYAMWILYICVPFWCKLRKYNSSWENVPFVSIFL